MRLIDRVRKAVSEMQDGQEFSAKELALKCKRNRAAHISCAMEALRDEGLISSMKVNDKVTWFKGKTKKEKALDKFIYGMAI